MSRCDFCGKTDDEVGKLMGQGYVMICGRCLRELMRAYELETEGFGEAGSWAAETGEKKPESEHRPDASKAKEFAAKGKGDRPDMRPREIFDFLGRYVVGQERARKVLSVAVYNHYKRLQDTTGRIRKNNILMVGPSGTGKTLLAETLAKTLDVPFAVVDSTSLTQAGYVGDDVEDIIKKLLNNADGNVERAQRGIVYLDEIDKIGRKSGKPTSGRDVGGEGVQQSLLKILEGSKIDVEMARGKKVTVDTSNILFICGGAFEGMLEENDKKKKSAFGFGAEVQQDENGDENRVTTDMLKEFGMLPELLGRLPVIVELDELTEEDLIRILTEPENALTKEYQALFGKDDVFLEFDKEALTEIAVEAMNRHVGARGLRSIMEQFMTDMMYEIPSMNFDDNDMRLEKSDHLHSMGYRAWCRITADTVHNGVPEIAAIRNS